MAAMGGNLKVKIEELKNSEWIKNKKIIAGIVAGAVAITIGITIIATRDNAFEIIVDQQVIGIIETQEEAQNVIKAYLLEKEEEGAIEPIITQQITTRPVHSKKNEWLSEIDLQAILEEELTYQQKAIKVLIDQNKEITVATKEVATAILEDLVKQQLPEQAEVELIIGKTMNEAPVITLEETEPEVQLESEVETEVKEVSEVEAEVKAESETEMEAETKVESEVEVETEVDTDTELESESTAKQATAEVEVEPEPEVETMPLTEGEEILYSSKQKQQSRAFQTVNIGSVTVDGKDYMLESTGNVQREIKAFDFYQQVLFEETYIDPTMIKEQEEAFNFLISNTDEIVYYEMEEGDNVWDLAIDNDTTMDRILEINPQIVDVSRMQIGEVIKLEAPDPVLSTVITQEATFKELIPSEIEYVEFSDLYKDETKVYQEGHDGLKEITVMVDKVNGKEVGRELIAETLVKEPKTKVIAFGTKEKPKPKPISRPSSSNSSSSAGSSVSGSTSGMFMNPLNGAGYVSSHYGSRWGGFHRGIDIAAPQGTPIYAAASGTVTYSGYNNGGYGNLIIVNHGNGYETYYSHNYKNYVNVGQYVNKGQNIGGVGSTGDSTGNHLHFEIRRNGSPINPYSYIY